MKKQTKKQIVAESFYKVEDDVDVQKLREKKEREARELRAYHEVLESFERQRQYMWGGVCLAHDRIGCPQCVRAARGECPSAIEENPLPHDF